MNAIQWRPGVAIEGVTTDEGTVYWSAGRSYYYVTRGGMRPRFWLGERLPGPVPEEKKAGKGDGDWYQFQRGDDVYHRQALDFAFYKVRTSRPTETEPTTVDSELFKDYASAARWSEEECLGPPTLAVYHIGETDALLLHTGDWLITGPDGKRFVLSDDKYQAARQP